MYGLWQASGRPDQGSQTNLYWECWPNVVINPGVYTIIDSHPASWSWNSQSGGGITIIKGVLQGKSQSPAKAPSSGQAGDASSVKAAAGTPAMSGTQPVDLSIVGGLPPAISTTAPSVAVGISGSWSGSYKNTRGESGTETLDIKEEPGEVLKGLWGGVEIVNGRRGGDGVTWEAHVEARDYQVRGTISSDGRRMTLQYSVRDPSRGNYSGVEELARH